MSSSSRENSPASTRSVNAGTVSRAGRWTIPASIRVKSALRHDSGAVPLIGLRRSRFLRQTTPAQRCRRDESTTSIGGRGLACRRVRRERLAPSCAGRRQWAPAPSQCAATPRACSFRGLAPLPLPRPSSPPPKSRRPEANPRPLAVHRYLRKEQCPNCSRAREEVPCLPGSPRRSAACRVRGSRGFFASGGPEPEDLTGEMNHRVAAGKVRRVLEIEPAGFDAARNGTIRMAGKPDDPMAALRCESDEAFPDESGGSGQPNNHGSSVRYAIAAKLACNSAGVTVAVPSFPTTTPLA